VTISQQPPLLVSLRKDIRPHPDCPSAFRVGCIADRVILGFCELPGDVCAAMLELMLASAIPMTIPARTRPTAFAALIEDLTSTRRPGNLPGLAASNRLEWNR